VEYAPRGGVRLSRGGEQLALHVLRRHRLLELFLVNIVGLDWSEVHDDAEELEHVVSDRLLDRIDALLGYPSVDPHGDPIPTAKGRLAPVSATSLLQCELNTPMRITRVLDQAPPFLRFVTQHGLVPDATLIVQSRSEEADAVALRPAGRKPVTLGAAAAAKILVEAA
jgi:DtxR family Mn-dependent transcriptional regulator